MEAIEGTVFKSDEDDGVFDLDEWLREVADGEDEDGEGEAVAPYTFTTGGRLYSMVSADDFDWQETARLTANGDDVQMMMQLLLGEGQYEEFCTNKLPNKAIKKLLAEWEAHYNISVPESRASRRKSQRTARPSKPTSRRRTGK